MKTYCKKLNIDRALIEKAYDDWLAGAAGRKNAWRVPKEHGSADHLINEIADEIKGRCLATKPIGYKTRIEPTNGKERVISIESVKQQVLDYVLHLCIADLLDAKIGYYQTASIRDKGQVWNMRHIKRWRGDGPYFVKTDFRKCYPSIPHECVMRVLRKYVSSDDVLYLAGYLLSTYRDTSHDYGFPDRGRRGVNIGSRFSLDMVNLVLSYAYHHLESLHKIRRGKKSALFSHQIWFMDDCLLIGHDKRDLKRAVRSMAAYMNKEFGMELKPWKICRISNRHSEFPAMAGYSHPKGRTVVSEGTFKRAKRCFARFLKRRGLKLARRVCSYYGWLKHANCREYMEDNGVWKALRLARKTVAEHDRRLAWSM